MRKVVRFLGISSALWIVGALLVSWNEISYACYFIRHKSEILSKHNAEVQAFESQEALKKQKEDESKKAKEALLQKQEFERLVGRGVSVDVARILTSRDSLPPQEEDRWTKILSDLALENRPDYPRYRKPEARMIMTVAFIPPMIAWLLLLSAYGAMSGVRYLGQNFEFQATQQSGFQLNALQRWMAGLAGTAVLVVVWQGIQKSEIGAVALILSLLSMFVLFGFSVHGLKRK